MPSPRDTDVGELLRQLSDAGVEFIVVGGAAAVLHGAPITTEDLDIVHRRSPENVARLETLLDELGAHVREVANRRLPPQESALLGEGHVLLSTRLGPLDCLGTLIDGRGFEELVSHSESIKDEGVEFLVVDLPTLIELKTKTGRAKDRLMLPVLIALAEQLEDSKG
ncbi:MAG: nucleotidyltransferase [Myxococcales bacterium]|nr:nucleotidyltransferase [Myxococcales bacterium]MDH3842776.1 nucleotidyltransferase [Myxococcales bacterium]